MYTEGPQGSRKPTDEEKEMVMERKVDCEEKGGEQYSEFEPIACISHEEEGTEGTLYWFKVRIDTGYIDVQMFKQLNGAFEVKQV